MEINCHDHFGENDTIADKRYDRDRIFLLWKIMKIHMQSGIKKYDHVNPSSRMTVIYLDTHNFTTAVVKEIASCMMLKVTMHSLRKFMNKVNFIRRASCTASKFHHPSWWSWSSRGVAATGSGTFNLKRCTHIIITELRAMVSSWSSGEQQQPRIH